MTRLTGLIHAAAGGHGQPRVNSGRLLQKPSPTLLLPKSYWSCRERQECDGEPRGQERSGCLHAPVRSASQPRLPRLHRIRPGHAPPRALSPPSLTSFRPSLIYLRLPPRFPSPSLDKAPRGYMSRFKKWLFMSAYYSATRSRFRREVSRCCAKKLRQLYVFL
ncbi:hypothetical protein E2C01_022737 [Portunus trituberculatus]|uniref:Uncharacterized protein n=1 Tax=Portunus trituberculatus TaxID=210409 RepID=A0A5B7E653_PORTR|nr:hypothetical protein [Portunus trituberculatus]